MFVSRLLRLLPLGRRQSPCLVAKRNGSSHILALPRNSCLRTCNQLINIFLTYLTQIIENTVFWSMFFLIRSTDMVILGRRLRTVSLVCWWWFHQYTRALMISCLLYICIVRWCCHVVRQATSSHSPPRTCPRYPLSATVTEHCDLLLNISL